MSLEFCTKKEKNIVCAKNVTKINRKILMDEKNTYPVMYKPYEH